MKIIILNLFFVFLVSLSYGQKVPKEAIQSLAEIVYIEGGTFSFGYTNKNYFSEKMNSPFQNDSILNIPKKETTITVDGFFLGKKEVTNAEYRKFVKWVQDSIAHSLLGHTLEYPGGRTSVDWEQSLDWSEGGFLDIMFLQGDEQMGSSRSLDTRKLVYNYEEYPVKRKVRVYPDTLCWIRDSGFTYDEKMTRNYFHDKTYDNFPVVGISKEQALAYCIWKENSINRILRKAGADPISISLPTEEEWEYAATGGKEASLNTDRSSYPWEGNLLTNKKGEYFANFGFIYDLYGLEVKHSFQDGYRYSAPSGSFPANASGLYDLAGNVEEWVITKTNEKETAKGGSWNKGLIYMLCSSKAEYRNGATHSHIGFRIKVSYDKSSSTSKRLKILFNLKK